MAARGTPVHSLEPRLPLFFKESLLEMRKYLKSRENSIPRFLSTVVFSSFLACFITVRSTDEAFQFVVCFKKHTPQVAQAHNE